MASLKRILASRANGARSRGPKTAEGKARASQNAIRHGLVARCVVLSNESPEGFKDVHDKHRERLLPSDGAEEGFVEEMASSVWRMRRLWAIETRMMDDALAAQRSGDEIGRLAAAFTALAALAARPELSLLHRYESRLHTIYQRALHNLLLLRTADIPNEPDKCMKTHDHDKTATSLAEEPGPATQPRAGDRLD